MNPIQQAIEALERNLSWLSSYPGEGAMRPNGPYDQTHAALTSLRSLNKEVEGVTVEHIRAAGGIVHSDGNIFFTNIDQLRTAIAAALGRGVVPQGLLKAIRLAGYRAVLTGSGYELWPLKSETEAHAATPPATGQVERDREDAELLRRALYYLEADAAGRFGVKGLEDMVRAGDHPVVADLRKRLGGSARFPGAARSSEEKK